MESRYSIDNLSKNAGKIERMFSEIAPSYDMLNRLLSAGIDRRWRRIGVNSLAPKDGRYLDIATGTCDYAIEIRKQAADATIIAADFSMEMVKIGKTKVAGKSIHVARGDGLNLCFKENYFHGITCGFGIRNFENLSKGLTEILRVLKPSGKIAILEFTTPANPIVRAFYLFYFTKILPSIGKLFSGHSEAYEYLPKSAINFPNRARLKEIFEECGFENVVVKPLTFGICDLISGEKPKANK